MFSVLCHEEEVTRGVGEEGKSATQSRNLYMYVYTCVNCECL